MTTILLHHLVEEPRQCSYLSDRTASLEHRIQQGTTPEELEDLLSRGWRRFGPDYFRPLCTGCSDCVPTRLDVTRFELSRSQRRARNRCASLRTEIGVPAVDPQRLDLYHRWHAAREQARGWNPSALTPRQYALQFAFPHPAAREVALFDDSGAEPELVGIGICDETPNAWSAIYFFYDPKWSARSIGVANILRQVEIGKARGRRHLYLGYRVDGCPSMQYKAGYQPQERLVGWPNLEEAPVWEALDERSTR